MLATFERADGENPYSVHHDLQQTMHTLVGIFRVEEDLQRAMSELEKLKQRAAKVRVEVSCLFDPGLHLARDLQNMFTVAEAVTRSAIARKESRGAHSRIDFAGLDAEWGKKNNIIQRDGDTMRLRQSPLAEMPEEVKQILTEQKLAETKPLAAQKR